MKPELASIGFEQVWTVGHEGPGRARLHAYGAGGRHPSGTGHAPGGTDGRKVGAVDLTIKEARFPV